MLTLTPLLKSAIKYRVPASLSREHPIKINDSLLYTHTLIHTGSQTRVQHYRLNLWAAEHQVSHST